MNDKNQKQRKSKGLMGHLALAVRMLLLLPGLVLFSACNDWNEPTSLNIDLQHAKEQNPVLWARYMESLRVYKLERAHYLTYGNFANGSEKPKNEGNYLRSLPDSLDMVSLANSENITAYDREDIPALQEKSTKVLYLVDYAAKADKLADAAALGAWLDKAVAAATELHLDGFAFNGLPNYGGTDAEQAASKEAAKLIVSKLSAFGKTLVFEGNPAFIDAADLAKIDCFVLDTSGIATAVNLKLYVTNAIETYALPLQKVILAAKKGNTLIDEENKKQDAVEDMTNRVISLGPVAGLAIYALGDDYYSADKDYPTCRSAIQAMNPAE